MAEEKKEQNKTTKVAEKKDAPKKTSATKSSSTKKTTAKTGTKKTTSKSASGAKSTGKASSTATKTSAKASTKKTTKTAEKKTVAKKTTTKKTTAKKSTDKPAAKNSAKVATKTTAKKSVKQSSADSLLGIKDKKKISAKDKIEKRNKAKNEKAKYEEALQKRAEEKKKKKIAKKAKGSFIGNKLKNVSANRKMKKMKKAEAKKNTVPKYSVREKKLIRKRIFIVLAATILSAVCVLGIFKIFGALELNAGYAAKVGDKYITEQEVTKYIKEQSLFKTYSKSLSQWQQYMSMYGMTCETFRNQIIESKFIHEELVRLACEQEGISVSDEEINSHLQSFKNKYNNDTNFKKALENAGYTEETYRDYLRNSMLEKQLIAKVVTTTAPTDDDVKTYLTSYSSAYKDARKAAHIQFDAKDEVTAQSVLDQLNAGSLKWEDAVNKYSIDQKSKSNNGIVGWDKIESFSMTFNDSLSGLVAGEMCKDLVTDKDGIHIVKCVEKWETPEKIESLDGVPQEIIEHCRQKKNETNQATELKTWLDNFVSENGIETEVFPMPKSVPYYVETKTKINSNALTSGAVGGSGSSVPISTE